MDVLWLSTGATPKERALAAAVAATLWLVLGLLAAGAAVCLGPGQLS